jgi:hypothetical protein
LQYCNSEIKAVRAVSPGKVAPIHDKKKANGRGKSITNFTNLNETDDMMVILLLLKGSSSWGQQQQTPFNQQGGQDGDRYQNPQMGNYGAGFGNVPQTTAVRLGTPLRFCTVTNEEHSHCLKMVFDLERNFVRSNEPLQLAGNRGKRQTPSTRFYFECVRAVDK